MSSEKDDLKKQLAEQQRQLDQLTKEVAQFRTLALAACKDVEQVRANQDYLLRVINPVLPVLRRGRYWIGRLKGIATARPASPPTAEIHEKKK